MQHISLQKNQCVPSGWRNHPEHPPQSVHRCTFYSICMGRKERRCSITLACKLKQHHAGIFKNWFRKRGQVEETSDFHYSSHVLTGPELHDLKITSTSSYRDKVSVYELKHVPGRLSSSNWNI